MTEPEQQIVNELLDTGMYKLDMKKAESLRKLSQVKKLSNEAAEETFAGKKFNKKPSRPTVRRTTKNGVKVDVVHNEEDVIRVEGGVTTIVEPDCLIRFRKFASVNIIFSFEVCFRRSLYRVLR